MKAIRLLLAVAVASSAGCVTYDRGTLAAVSTTIVPIEMAVVAENVEGKACGDVFEDPFERAIDDAVQSSPGANALVDVTYHFERLCMIVRGTAVRLQAKP
jgi:hypothetical protein